MKITYKNTYLDALWFNCVHQFMSFRFQALFVALLTFVFLVEMGSKSQPGFSAALLTTLQWYVVLWIVQVLATALMLYSRKNHGFITQHTLEITDAALVETTLYNRTEAYWFGLNEIVRRPGFMAIYVTKAMAHIVPSRAFSSVEERERFFDLVSEKIRVAKAASEAGKVAQASL
jgi:hypothetical protein